MPDTNIFKTGDIVQLKSGGPNMTVNKIIGDSRDQKIKNIELLLKASKGYKDGDVKCQWFVNNELKEGYFTPETLKSAEGS
ncbi:MAG TPA: DUF2158 domain-containing protein [Ignavibacteria bacterium]